MIDVLVLDDDVYVGRLHCRYVEQTPGFRALEPVRDLRSARKVLAAGGVDLLLADEVLPDGTGTQLIRETSVDAALLTAVTDAQVVRAALSAGALTCLFKPFDPEQLTSLLRRYARLRRVWEQERLSQAGLDRALRGFYDAGGAGASPESRAGGTSARILEALQRAQVEDMSEKDIAREIKRLEKQMLEHARNLEFEQAARLRDQLALLKERAFGAHGSDPMASA